MLSQADSVFAGKVILLALFALQVMLGSFDGVFWCVDECAMFWFGFSRLLF